MTNKHEPARLDFSGRSLSPFIKKVFEKFSSTKSRVECLDLGCGDGAMLVDLNEGGLITKNVHLTGIDISEGNIEMCKKRLPNLRFLVGDAERTPFASSTFDFIYSWMVIEHVKNPERMVAETLRLLKKGGKGYFSSIIKKPWAIYFYRNNHKFVLDPTHINEFGSGADFLKLFRKPGIKIVGFTKKVRVYSILELILKILIKVKILKSGFELRNLFRRNKIANIIRRTMVIPIPGFYQVEVLYEKSIS